MADITRDMLKILCCIFCCVFGVVLYVHFQDFHRTQVFKRLVISPEAPESLWLNSPPPVFLKIYMFNVTNSQQVAFYHAKPVLQECGPYVFRERLLKTDVTYHENSTVSYKLHRSFEFLPDLSNASLLDSIVTLNMPALTLAHLAHEGSWMLEMAVDLALKNNREKMFVTHSVQKLLFDGCHSRMMSLIKDLPVEVMTVPFDTFAWYYKQNNSEASVSVHTGSDDITQVGTVDSWNGARAVKCWKGVCGVFRGSVGERYPPGIKRSDSLVLFVPALHRSLRLQYVQDVTTFGVPAFLFAASRNLFANSDLNHNNLCYEQRKPATGLLDLSHCLDGVPIFVSHPHFLFADDQLVESVEGLRPDEEEHQTSVVVSSKTGIPLKTVERLQFNVRLSQYSDINLYKNVTSVMLPMYWYERSWEVDQVMELKMRLLLSVVPRLFGVLLPLVMVVGSIVMLVYTARNRTGAANRKMV